MTEKQYNRLRLFFNCLNIQQYECLKIKHLLFKILNNNNIGAYKFHGTLIDLLFIKIVKNVKN